MEDLSTALDRDYRVASDTIFLRAETVKEMNMINRHLNVLLPQLH